MPRCFRCTHSGLLLPPDYVENWGKFYGVGLGPKPVSECLDTNYGHMPRMENVRYSASTGDFMFGVHSTGAPIEEVEVSEEDFNNPKNRMILEHEDTGMKRRLELIREKQKKKPKWQELQAYISQYRAPAKAYEWGTA